MRRLAEPDVLKSAGIAAAATALLCYPRLVLWSGRSFPLWYLEATLFVGGFVLWAFVFAWHTKYTGRPLFPIRLDPGVFALATGAGVAAAMCLHQFADPALRARVPMDYPVDFRDWLSRALFAFAFLQLFLTFAPFAWLMRLFRKQSIAIALTVLFGVVVLILKIRSSTVPVPSSLFALLLVFRVAGGLLALGFYLRGGIVLASWWGLLIESRLLFGLQD